MNRVLKIGAAICLSFAMTGVANASLYTVSTPGLGTLPLLPSGDSVTLSANSVSVPLGIFTLQTGTYNTAFSSFLSANNSYLFNESVTIDGETKLISLSVTNNVTPTLDTLTFLLGSPVYFAVPDVTLTTLSLSVSANTRGQFPFELKAELKQAPEPTTIVLFATALLALFGLSMARRQPQR